MAEGVVQISPSNDGPRERKAIRAAIIAAARAVAEREGVEAVSLGKVAVESGLERATVFQLFTRKEDLLTAIVSEDVATLASTMHNVDMPAAEETSDSAVIVPMPRQGEPQPVEHSTEVAGMARDVSEAMAQAPALPAASAPADRMRARRAELMRMLETNDGATEEGGEMKAESAVRAETADERSPRAPEALLEGRMREFEQAMAAMKDRYDQAERNSRAASVAAEDHIQALEQTIRELRDRADGAEARLKASSNEVRAALNETQVRIQTVEGVARAALVEGKATTDVAVAEPPVAEVAPPVPALVEPPPMAVNAVEAAPAPAEITAKDEAMPKSTMAQMRRTGMAANAAAAAALETPAKKKSDTPKADTPKADLRKADTAKADTAKAETPKPASLKPETAPKARRDNKTRYIVAGGVVALALAVAGGIAFSKGVYDGRREAMAQASTPASHAVALTTTRLIVPPHQTALDLLTTRAQAGDAAAEYAIATKYLRGTDTAKDPAAALHWLTLAAVHGQPVAQYLLGSLYQQGTGTPADPAKALQWFEASALQGNRRAMHNLGIAFAQGLGTERNMPEAVRWFSRAAAMGYVDSQFNLAVLYERGEGVPQSLLDAFKWYVIAGRQGDAESKQRVDALKTQLNPDDLTAAQHAADTFHPMPVSDAANVPPAD